MNAHFAFIVDASRSFSFMCLFVFSRKKKRTNENVITGVFTPESLKQGPCSVTFGPAGFGFTMQTE